MLTEAKLLIKHFKEIVKCAIIRSRVQRNKTNIIIHVNTLTTKMNIKQNIIDFIFLYVLGFLNTNIEYRISFVDLKYNKTCFTK